MVSLLEITYEYLESLRYVREIRRRMELGEYTDILALIGARRVGKTFMLLKKARELLDSGKQVIYASLDEPFLRKMDVRKFAELVRKDYPHGRVYLFLDEIQEWENWDFNLRWLHDVKDFRIYVSGSSSTLMSSEIPKRLRGRYISKILYPLSFRELVDFEVRTFRERGRILRLLEEYLKWGGFPEVWLQRSREKIISLLETIFFKDIIERFNIENIEIFKSVFYFTLSNYSNLISYRSINRILKSMGVDIDVKTLINYIGYMKQAFLVYTLEIFSYSQRSRIVNPRKLYVIDVSFSNLFPETLDIGRKIENLVFIELLRRSSPFTDISYYRTKGREEVDFLVRERGYVKDLIEVTYEVQQSHVKKMFKALNELKIKRGTIITWAEEDVIDIKDKCIEVVPLWKWLLKPSARDESIE